jgi:hypothetical protein
MNQIKLDYSIYAFGDCALEKTTYLDYNHIDSATYNKIYTSVEKKYKYQSEVIDQTIISNEGIYHNLTTGKTWKFTNGVPHIVNYMDFQYDNPIPFIINFNRKTYWIGGNISRYISFYSANQNGENKMMIVATSFAPL